MCGNPSLVTAGNNQKEIDAAASQYETKLFATREFTVYFHGAMWPEIQKGDWIAAVEYQLADTF